MDGDKDVDEDMFASPWLIDWEVTGVFCFPHFLQYLPSSGFTVPQ
jgi:hypothetical protein